MEAALGLDPGTPKPSTYIPRSRLTEKCYHCPTGHPALVNLTDLNKYWVETEGGHIIHFNTDKPDVAGLGNYSTFYYPNACMTVT